MDKTDKSFLTTDVLCEHSRRPHENLKREFDMLALVKLHPEFKNLYPHQKTVAEYFMIDLMIIRPITSRQTAALAINTAMYIARAHK